MVKPGLTCNSVITCMYVCMYMFIFILPTCYGWSLYVNHTEALVLSPEPNQKFFREEAMAYMLSELTLASNTAPLKEGAWSLPAGWARVAFRGDSPC